MWKYSLFIRLIDGVARFCKYGKLAGGTKVGSPGLLALKALPFKDIKSTLIRVSTRFGLPVNFNVNLQYLGR